MEWLSEALGWTLSKIYDGVGYVTGEFVKGVGKVIEGMSNTADMISEEYTDFVDDLTGKPTVRIDNPSDARKVAIDMQKSYDPNESKESRDKRKDELIKRYMHNKSND